MKLLFCWVINAAALLLVAYLIPGFEVSGIVVALVAALVLGLVNALVRPLLVVLTLPLTFVTLGLFLLVINALMLWLAASILPGFTIDTFFAAVYGAIVLWFVGLLTNWIIKT